MIAARATVLTGLAAGATVMTGFAAGSHSYDRVCCKSNRLGEVEVPLDSTPSTCRLCLGLGGLLVDIVRVSRPKLFYFTHDQIELLGWRAKHCQLVAQGF